MQEHRCDRLRPIQLVASSPEAELSQLIQESRPSGGISTGKPRHRPLHEICRFVVRLGARTVIIQRDVQDPDFLAEHAAYYAHWSQGVPRNCIRYHFFSEEIETEDPLAAIDHLHRSSNENYLGFLTLRPVRMSPVGVSILRQPSPELGRFILAVDRFPVDLAGRRFHVSGTPFMQQDNAVGACAQAAIWMALRTLRRKQGKTAHSPAQITSAATRFLVRGRTLPNRTGLYVEQIAEAVRSTGYSPHVIPLLDSDEKKRSPLAINTAKQALYAYVESGIPVLVLLLRENESSGGHAVLVIGHSWNAGSQDSILSHDEELGCGRLRVIDPSSWIEPFIIHNDNSGPYLPLPVVAQGSDYRFTDAYLAVPFLPPDVFIDGDEARETCLKLLASLLADVPAVEDQGAWTLPSLVGRVYLRERAEFRADVVASDMAAEVKRHYRLKWLPRRIWIMELNVLDSYREAPAGVATRVGEILLDPGSEPEDGAFLAVHLQEPLLPPGYGGVINDRDGITEEIRILSVPTQPYGPLLRDAQAATID